jgi:hypothetical protein
VQKNKSFRNRHVLGQAAHRRVRPARAAPLRDVLIEALGEVVGAAHTVPGKRRGQIFFRNIGVRQRRAVALPHRVSRHGHQFVRVAIIRRALLIICVRPRRRRRRIAATSKCKNRPASESWQEDAPWHLDHCPPQPEVMTQKERPSPVSTH